MKLKMVMNGAMKEMGMSVSAPHGVVMSVLGGVIQSNERPQLPLPLRGLEPNPGQQRQGVSGE